MLFRRHIGPTSSRVLTISILARFSVTHESEQGIKTFIICYSDLCFNSIQIGVSSQTDRYDPISALYLFNLFNCTCVI